MDLQTLGSYFQRMVDDPLRLLRVFISPCARGILLNSWREPTAYQFLRSISAITENSYCRYQDELRSDKNFYISLQTKCLEVRGKELPRPQGWNELLYILIRAIKPETIVETGVFDGISSTFILKALSKNNQGQLISVDLPARKVIPGSTDFMPFPVLPLHYTPGWLVPDALRRRWKLHIIKEGDELKNIVKNIKSIDIFLHDSLHTPDHMLWEMTTIWPKLKKGGLLLVDDVFCNCAFEKFSRNVKKEKVIKYGLGAIRK